MTSDMDYGRSAHALNDRQFSYRGLLLGLCALILIGTAVAWFAWTPEPPQIAGDEHAGEAEGEHAEEAEGEHAEEAVGVVLTPEQRLGGGVMVAPLQAMPLPRVFRATGEVRSNDYTTGIVGPRITATVNSRSAILGDRVTVGQPLVTLYSMEMAEAQGAFLLAQRNLERFESLRDIVAGQQIDEATVKRQEARGRLESYGLTASQISTLVERGFTNNTIGQFVLTAPQGGTITKDEFRVGDVVEAGRALFEIANLQNVWIEAHVSPALLPEMTSEKGLIVSGNLTREAIVVQRRETVDEATRTVGVRLEADNSDGALKPGQFVDVELYGATEPVLAVPSEAVQRNPDGDWAIYVENADGSFAAHEVDVLYAVDDQTAIAGIPAGTRIVTSGAFFLASEAAKAGFETHNH